MVERRSTEPKAADSNSVAFVFIFAKKSFKPSMLAWHAQLSENKLWKPCSSILNAHLF